MPEALDLSGRVAAITGATRGIGLAVAEALAGRGASIIVNCRSGDERAVAVCEDLERRFGVACVAVVGDVGDPGTHDAIARKAFGAFKRLDVYVNNAGILLDGLIGMVPESDIDTVLATNLKSVIVGTQAAARVMRRSGGGSIINLASIIGRFGNKGQLVYSAAKAGVIGATYAAAKELAALNIRVNAIAPGFIATEMTAALSEDKYRERVASIAMGRIGTAQDVAGLALFLASDLSTYVTGQVIGVDGGMLV